MKIPKKQSETAKRLTWLIIDTFTIHTLGNFFASTYNLPEIAWLSAFMMSCVVLVFIELWL